MGKSSTKSSSKSIGKGEMFIDPSIVRFTHSRIRPWFTGCGRRVEDTLQAMISGTQRAEELPLITVIAVKGDDNQMNYYSLNNRRLYVLKQLRDLGLLTDNQIRVRVKTPLDRERERYTVERCSLTATVMKEHRGATMDDTEEPVDSSDNATAEDDGRDMEESYERSK